MDLVYSARAVEDLERLFRSASEEDPALAQDCGHKIVTAVEILRLHPYIGRPVRGDLRELVISHGRTGYVALYRVARTRERVEVLAVRHQLEAGYA